MSIERLICQQASLVNSNTYMHEARDTYPRFVLYSRFDLKWTKDEPILRMFLRRIGDRRSPISNETAKKGGYYAR